MAFLGASDHFEDFGDSFVWYEGQYKKYVDTGGDIWENKKVRKHELFALNGSIEYNWKSTGMQTHGLQASKHESFHRSMLQLEAET
jgi:hypothetical protein